MKRHKPRLNLIAGLIGLAAAGAASLDASIFTIDGVSTPVGSNDAASHPVTDNVWSVDASPYPFNINSGIGYIINPTIAGFSTSEFSKHDHQQISTQVPDPSRSVVTYQSLRKYVR